MVLQGSYLSWIFSRDSGPGWGKRGRHKRKEWQREGESVCVLGGRVLNGGWLGTLTPCGFFFLSPRSNCTPPSWPACSFLQEPRCRHCPSHRILQGHSHPGPRVRSGPPAHWAKSRYSPPSLNQLGWVECGWRPTEHNHLDTRVRTQDCKVRFVCKVIGTRFVHLVPKQWRTVYFGCTAYCLCKNTFKVCFF